MIVDLDRYKVNKQVIQDWYLEKGQDDPAGCVSIIATATMVPCIVVAFYIGEVANFPEPIVKSINSLIKFYQYTQILNIPANCPKNLIFLFS